MSSTASSTPSPPGVRPLPRQLRQNPVDGPWIIQKYGGTSVGKFVETIAEQIVPSFIDSGNRVALVCSARSGESKATGTTNLLLRAAMEALRPRAPDPSTAVGRTSSPAITPGVASSDKISPLTTQIFTRSNSVTGGRSGASTPFRNSGSMASLSGSFSSIRGSAGDDGTQLFNATVDQIKQDHIAAARKVVKDVDILHELEEDLDYDCERLRSFLLAAQIIDEISTRSKDIIMGVGERLSCQIVTAVLRDQGIDAELVSLESIVEAVSEDDEPSTSKGSSSQQLGQSFYDRLSVRLGNRLAECGDRIPVITGFFGVVPGSLLTQVGRGYTDLCAALCAVGVSASELQVWKEVDGIFTADPRKVPTARLISTITPEEAAELTYYGSEVIHPFTMEQVIRASIPIRIKNVENPSGGGTIIFPDPSYTLGSNTPPDDVVEDTSGTKLREALNFIDLSSKRLPTAVTIKDDILVLSIRSNRKTISHGFFARIFGTLDRYGIIVDLISTSEVHVSMAINGSIRKPVLDRVTAELHDVGEVSVLRDMAILSLVGKQMKNMVGIAGKMFSTLAEGNINIEMISQGASEINISCVIDGGDAIKALNVVHHRLLTVAPVKAAHSAEWFNQASA